MLGGCHPRWNGKNEPCEKCKTNPSTDTNYLCIECQKKKGYIQRG